MEIAQMLERAETLSAGLPSRRSWNQTYKKPRQKTPIKTRFWALTSCSVRNPGSGRTKMTMSLTILNTELIYHKGSLGKHCASIVTSQNPDIGLQKKTVNKTWSRPQSATIPIPMLHASRILVLRKTRRYCNRKAILVAVKA